MTATGRADPARCVVPAEALDLPDVSFGLLVPLLTIVRNGSPTIGVTAASWQPRLAQHSAGRAGWARGGEPTAAVGREIAGKRRNRQTVPATPHVSRDLGASR
ncbi:hypothetical protein NicSoilB4_20420 [Arthrobacter sp. NicSoilB4]|nr:hypothetical protein NicSoilB4_20420 [Arthrobacter sp. NicSoilB4]